MQVHLSARKGSFGTCEAVKDVDEEIKRLTLRSEQNRVHDPMNRLPIELRNYIFELALRMRDEWGDIGESQQPKRGVMPSYLTSICKGWRDITCSNPLLWSTMHITLGGQVSRSLRLSPTTIVREWISHSRTLSLTFHIVVKWAVDGEEELKDLLDAISECSSRCYSLSLKIPIFLLPIFHHDNFKYDRLRKLRVTSHGGSEQSSPFFNPQLRLDTIDIRGLRFWMLQISWNHLTSATVDRFYPEEITQLFQYASELIHCRILYVIFCHNLVMRPIIHQKLEKLFLRREPQEVDLGFIMLGSLTLPSLKEFDTDEPLFLTPAYLPALVRRSSCPLTTIALLSIGRNLDVFRDLQPFPGVTGLVFDSEMHWGAEAIRMIKELLGGEYFPDLHHLTIQLLPFWFLWEQGLFLALNRSRRGAPDKGLRKILVKGRSQSGMKIGEQLKALQLDSIVREDALEILF